MKAIRRNFHQTYFFYEKSTGVSHFHVEAAQNGQFPSRKRPVCWRCIAWFGAVAEGLCGDGGSRT